MDLPFPASPFPAAAFPAGAAATLPGTGAAVTDAAGLGWLGSTTDWPTGFKRLAIASSDRAGWLLSPSPPLVTSAASIEISTIGTRKAATITATSCSGVLIGEECSSV